MVRGLGWLKKLVNLFLRRNLRRGGSGISQHTVDLAFEPFGVDVVLVSSAQIHCVAVGTRDDCIQEAGVGISAGGMSHPTKVHYVRVEIDQIQRAGSTSRMVACAVLCGTQQIA